MTFLNNNLNKPKLNGIKKPTIKMPKLEPKVEIKPTEPEAEEIKIEAKEESQELEFNPTPVEEAHIEEPTVEEEPNAVEEPVDEVAEQQQTFDEFKTLEETEEPIEIPEEVTETKEEVAEPEVEEETPVVEEPVVEEEKPKKKRTRKKATKKEESTTEEEPTVSLAATMMGSNDLDFMDEYLTEIVNPTNPGWEEEKVIVNSKMDEIVIDTDMGSAEMDEMLSKLSHLENDVRQRLDEIAPIFFNIQDLVSFVEASGEGSNATERKANGKLACTRYVKEPGAEPINLYTYFNFQRARYEFYKSKMEQIKNENGRLITLSAVKKLEVNLSR